MIFKTFNNDIDKISAKWGIFGKSFNDIGTAISGKISDINKNFQATDDIIGSIKNSGDGIWARLYPTKEQITSLQINVPELIDTKKANEYLNIMNQIDAGIHPVLSSYQEWHDELADGEKWIAKYAQSTKGQIRSLEGVNEANQSARASALAHNEALKQQTLGAKAATVAMKALSVVGNMLAMYAITKLITAYSDYKEKLHDIAEEMSAQAKKSSDYVDNLLDLKTQLEEGAKSSDELTSAFKDQLEAMGYTETEIDNLINKYNGLSGAIDEATRKALENAKTDAYADVASASKALEIDSDGGLFTDILIGDYKTGLEQLDSEIEKIFSDVATKTAQQGRAWTAKDHSAEGLYEYYNALKDVSRLIQETASETNNNELLDLGNAFDPTVYGEVTEAINKLKDSAELYGEAISRLHNADAQLELSDYLKTNDINSTETFDNYINGIKNSTEYSESYKQVLIDVANKAFPQFSKQAENAAETLDNFGNETDISFNIEDFSDNISEITSAYSTLSSAIEEYNTNGAYSLETMTKLLSLKPEYLALLVDENGKLALNEEGLRSIIQAQLEQAQAEIYATGIAKLKALSDEEAGNASEKAASKMSNSTSDIDAQTEAYNQNTLAVAANEAIKDGANKANVDAIIKETEAQVKAIQNAVNGLSFNTTGVIGGFKDSAKKATEDAEKATKDYIDSYMDYMEQSLESGRIDYQTYSRYVAKFLKDMYDQGKIAAKDYHDYTKEMLEVQKDIYDKALSAVTGLLDDEIDKYEECIKTVEKQNDALEEQKTLMENAASAVSDYYQKLIDGIENTNDALDEQNEKLEEQLSDMDSAINAVETYYDTLVDADQKTIDNLNEKNDSIQLQIEKYDSLISVADRLYTEEQDNLKAQQDSIQEKIDLLQEENNQKDLQYRKEEALYELQRSQQQRTKKLYVVDKGYIYDTDKKAIRDAQKNLQDIETEELVSSLEKEKEALQDSIDSLQEYRDALSEISDAYQKLVDERNAAELLGEGYKNLILETNIDDWLELKDKYIQANDEIADNEDLIKSHEDKIKIWEEEKEQWSSLPQSIIDETNKQKATEKFGADWEKQINEGRFNAFDSFKKNYLDIQSKINDNTETINSNNEKIEQYNKLKEEWDSLTNSLDENTKSQAAIQMFGADWEKQLNDGRLISYDAFKNQYLSIESQINDNTLLIDSYNEKIEYYENLKNQWNSVTSAYEDEMNKQYAAQIIGANWESDVLNGRLGTLDNFKNQYISIQQAIADAAWASANEQIKAAQAASDSANEQIKSSSPGGNHGYKAYIGNELIGVYNSKNEANDAAQKEVSNRAESEARKAAEKNGGKDATSIYNNTKMGVGSNLTKKIKIKPYASGTNNAKKGLNLVGEDGIETFIDNEGNISLVTEPTLIPMEGGEIVKNEKETKSLLDSMNLVPIQTGDIWKKFATNMPDLSSMINVNVPDYSKISGMFSKAQTIEQHNQFNVTLPNITDSTKATKLFEALQYANTRKK